MKESTYYIIAIILVLISLMLIFTPMSCSGSVSESASGRYKEGFDPANPLNTEALQNIASIYNNQNLAVTSLTTGNLTATGAINFVPKGTIVMFFGDPKSIPIGWAICDGKNGTPNLVNRFIRGTDKPPVITSGVFTAKIGGTDKTSVTLEAGNIPDHTHTYTYQTITRANVSGAGAVNLGVSGVNPINGTTGGIPNIGALGGARIVKPVSIDTVPAYTEMMFIMKL